MTRRKNQEVYVSIIISVPSYAQKSLVPQGFFGVNFFQPQRVCFILVVSLDTFLSGWFSGDVTSLCSQVIRPELMCLTQYGLHLKYKTNRKILYIHPLQYFITCLVNRCHTMDQRVEFLSTVRFRQLQYGIYHVRWHIIYYSFSRVTISSRMVVISVRSVKLPNILTFTMRISSLCVYIIGRQLLILDSKSLHSQIE